MRGVYHVAGLRDSLELRLECLRLVVPPDAVVTDRTAAWLWGTPHALAPGDHLVVPALSVYRPPGYRLRNKLVASGERMLSVDDIESRGGVSVTTPLRTACDVGRLLHRDQALGALDALARACELTPDHFASALPRFRGYRGVRQLRQLVPLVDPRSESPGESILRLRWHDLGSMPRAVPQVAVPGPKGLYYPDLGADEVPYGAEYDGAEWHGPERREHDRDRREWIRAHSGYVVDVFTAEDISGRDQAVWSRLSAGVRRAGWNPPLS